MRYTPIPIEFKIRNKAHDKFTVVATYIGKTKRRGIAKIENVVKSFTTEAEALEFVDQVKEYRRTESIDITAPKYRAFYGCNYCKDSRDAGMRELGDNGHAKYCIHKECPYAEEIEQYDGFIGYMNETERNWLWSEMFKGLGD